MAVIHPTKFPSLKGTKTTVFLPAGCNERAHTADVCDPVCNQSGFSCNDLAPVWIRQLQSSCARPADVCDPDRGCLQVATGRPYRHPRLRRRTLSRTEMGPDLNRRASNRCCVHDAWASFVRAAVALRFSLIDRQLGVAQQVLGIVDQTKSD